jgi:hypothetical protein
MLFFPSKIFRAVQHELMTQHYLDIDGSVDTWKSACVLLRLPSLSILEPDCDQNRGRSSSRQIHSLANMSICRLLLTIFVTIVHVYAYTDPSVTNPQLVKRFEYKSSFKGPHLAFKDGTVPFWTFGGSK